jgi:hypothetical protein
MISSEKQGHVSAKDWDEALRVLASLGANVEFITKDLTEELKPAIVSLSRALLVLKTRYPQAVEEKRKGPFT